MFGFGKKTPSAPMPIPSRARSHQKPTISQKLVRQHQKREELRIKTLEKGLKDRSLGLYVHIPFCKSKCAYCDFYSLAGHEIRMDAYANALSANIKETAETVSAFSVNTVYIGGGTPSFFGEQRLKTLIQLIKKSFRLSRDVEFTVECNPESVSYSLIRTLRRAGVNRISLGMQSAQDDELKAVGRPHTMAQVESAVASIRKAKIKNLSLDLIYGLPEQSFDDWKASVEAAIRLNAEHLSLYALTLEEGTPLWNRRSAVAMADDDELADRYLWAVSRLAEAGYQQYEISNFAKAGYESCHNLKYWRGEEYLGFGPSAHSDFSGCRYSYVANLEDYIDGVISGKKIVDEYEQIPLAERAREYLMLRLRTVDGISASEYQQKYHRTLDALAAQLQTFAEQGLAVCEGERWHFTPEGFLLSNQLIGSLLDLQEADMRQSRVPSCYNTP